MILMIAISKIWICEGARSPNYMKKMENTTTLEGNDFFCFKKELDDEKS